MKYLLIPILWALSTIKVTIQSKYSKSKTPTLITNMFFNAVMFTTVAVIFAPSLFAGGAEPHTVIYGMLMGILSVIFQVFYIFAFSMGKTSLTVMINNFSLLIPMTISFLCFDEKLGALKIIGIFLILVSFLLNISRDSDTDGNASKKVHFLWLFYTLLVFLSNGLVSSIQKIYSKTAPSFQLFQYIAIAYITASLIAWITFAIICKKENSSDTADFKFSSFIAPVICGLFLGAFQCANTYSASIIDGVILFPVTQCGGSLILTLVGKYFFKEKLSNLQCIGVFVGILAITLISI